MTDDVLRRPAPNGSADTLLVLLHGYGADARDLIDIAEMWARDLPGAAVFAPHAPEPCAGAPFGRQWFALESLDLHSLRRGVDAAAPALAQRIRAEQARLGLAPERLLLMGFSQGAMMALKLAVTLDPPPTAAVAFSGLYAGGAVAGTPPPLLLIHGALDDVVPAYALQASVSALAAEGVHADWHLAPTLGHTIDADGLARGGRFLAGALAALPGKAAASQD